MFAGPGLAERSAPQNGKMAKWLMAHGLCLVRSLLGEDRVDLQFPLSPAFYCTAHHRRCAVNSLVVSLHWLATHTDYNLLPHPSFFARVPTASAIFGEIRERLT